MTLLLVFIMLGYLILFFGISSASKNALLEQNVNMLKKQSDAYYKLANCDALTGIANRKHIIDYIEKSLNDYKDIDKKIAFIMFDIDKFKGINDQYGHQVGDKALKYVVSRIKNCIREDDFIGRLGGDEFLVVSKNFQTSTDIEALIDRIIHSLGAPLKIDDYLIYIDISIGISVFPADGVLMDDLLERADQAMYRAKKREGTTYELFNENF